MTITKLKIGYPIGSQILKFLCGFLPDPKKVKDTNRSKDKSIKKDEKTSNKEDGKSSKKSDQE